LMGCLESGKRTIRYSCAECLILLAKHIDPQHILNMLITNLNTSHRALRAGSTLSIGLMGQHHGLYTIIPSLMCEYAIRDNLLRCGILKSLTVAFENTREDVSNYVPILMPLIEDALTEKDPVCRTLSMNLITNIVLCYRTCPNVPILVHLLNFVFPNILEINNNQVCVSFDNCFESFSRCLGGAYLYKYIVQGLCHPAKAVRKRYQSISNILEKHYPGLVDSCIEEEKKYLCEIKK